MTEHKRSEKERKEIMKGHICICIKKRGSNPMRSTTLHVCVSSQIPPTAEDKTKFEFFTKGFTKVVIFSFISCSLALNLSSNHLYIEGRTFIHFHFFLAHTHKEPIFIWTTSLYLHITYAYLLTPHEVYFSSFLFL